MIGTTNLASDGQLAVEQTLVIRAPGIAEDGAGAGTVAAAGLVVLFASTWVIIGRHADELGSLNRDARWTPLLAKPSTPLWTDDFSNILGVLDFQ